jgi:uncharacterized protein involved in exopolysaccharide biosynthesis/Mrp family chromosome partitioning ATPase
MIEGRQTKREPVEMPALGMKLSDIYYVIFRQKWLIAAFLGVGMIASLIVFLGQKTLYWSEAKLLVRYVTEMKAPTGTPVQSELNVETAINSEMEILTSLDLCEEVARLVGAEKVLNKNGQSNVTSAAIVIYSGIKIESPRRSNIIKVRFSHSDPAMCQVILRQIINSYLADHDRFHRLPPEYQNLLSEQARTLAFQIGQHEEELRKLKQRAGVISVDEDRRNHSERLARLRQQLDEAESELAGYRAMAGNVAAPVKSEPEPADAGIPPPKILEYRVTCRLLESAREREFKLLAADYTEENPLIVRVREQITEAEARKNALEEKFPKLTSVHVPPAAGTPSSLDARVDPRHVDRLEAKIAAFSNQMAQVQYNISLLNTNESAITEVQRKLDQAKQSFIKVAAGVDTMRIEDVLSGAKNNNITAVQTPSPPAPNVSQRLKLTAGTFFGILVAGIAAAFFIEIFADRTIRRADEIETKLKIPLFLSIPKLGLNGHAKMLPFPVPSAEPATGGEATGALAQTWDDDHPLRRYIDGLRDATLTHFGGDPHKPKLIGITSCGEDSGVTSIAAGLAGALSETGEGNVLLLNLNYEAEAAHPFYRGELACCLTDALELDKRVNGKVLQNLYVATAGDPSDPATQSLPKQLARVVPKLRVCDYDYIVFDLPPTTPTTMTARLAGMMDLVILVVESEKDTHETVKQAGKLLARSKAPVSAVLNKVRNPVPKWLQKGA